MANNVEINAATESPEYLISTEDIGGGLQMPRSKVVLGASGTDGGDVSNANPMPVVTPNLQQSPVVLFDQTTNQAGVTQSALLFPTTVTVSALPAVGSGLAVNITNSGNVCGSVFAPKYDWSGLYLDIIGAGAASTNTITLEIGRLKASGAVPDVLASVVLTASAITLGPTAVNPFTGASHASQTWRFFDAVTITSLSTLGDVLVSVNGVSGSGPSQLMINIHDVTYYYVLIKALNAAFTEILCCITPIS